MPFCLFQSFPRPKDICVSGAFDCVVDQRFEGRLFFVLLARFVLYFDLFRVEFISTHIFPSAPHLRPLPLTLLKKSGSSNPAKEKINKCVT